MKGAIWMPQAHGTSLKVLPISNISLISTTLESCFALTESSDLYEIDLIDLSITQLTFPISICQIICSSTVSMFLGSGQVFLYGVDIEKTGVLGPETPNLKQLKKIEIPGFVVKGALSSHAAVIDLDGNVFTWGNGLEGQLGWTDKSSSEIGRIENQDFKASSVACGKDFTAVLSEGGFVYIYGSVNKEKIRINEKGRIPPISISQFEKFLALQIVAGDNFLCVLVESGECFAFDSCMDLVKLPMPNGFSVRQIECSSNSAYGLGDNGIIEWGEMGNEKAKCEVSKWPGKLYRLFENSPNAKIFSSANHFSAVFEGSLINSRNKFELFRPYKIQSFDEEIEGFSINKEPGGRTPCDLGSPYPTANNEFIVIEKFRRGCELINRVCSVLKGQINKKLEIGFKGVKELTALKKNYEKTLAAALIVPPIEKVLQRGIMTVYLFAVKSISLYAKEKQKIALKKKEAFNAKNYFIEEKVIDLYNTLCDKYYKELYNGFSLIKELEMRRLQKQTAVLSISQVLFTHLKSLKKSPFKAISQKMTNLKELKKIISKILTRSFQRILISVQFSLKNKLEKSASINKSIGDLFKKIMRKKTRKNFLNWKKQAEKIKSSELRRKFSVQISLKSLNLILSYAILKSYRAGFFSLISTKKKNFITPTLFFVKKVKSLIHSKKSSIFREIKVLTNRYRSLAFLFKALFKLNKKRKRQVLKNFELNQLTFRKTTYLKSCIALHFTLFKVLKKWLAPILSSLKFYTTPYSPRKLLGKTPDKPAKNSSVFFNTEPDLKSKLKYIKQKSCTSIDLSSPRNIITPILSNNCRTGELSVLEKTLTERKMLDQKNKVLKKNNKPPLRPPWRPVNTTTNASLKKMTTNACSNRNDNSNIIVKRTKCHSKQSSSDLSNCLSSPTLSSRTSSRQKTFQKGSISANWKFGFMIIDNILQNSIGKKISDSWYEVKNYCNDLEKTEAPRPLDSGNWKKNLYKIGFELLRKFGRKVIGRKIITLIKNSQ